MVLVCTHGTRDACCAVRGRPIVAALARALPEQVWECTHLGGTPVRRNGAVTARRGLLRPARPGHRGRSVVRAHWQGRTDGRVPARAPPAGSRRCRPRSSRPECPRPGVRRGRVPGHGRGRRRPHPRRGDRQRAHCPSCSSSTSSPRRCPTHRSAAATGPRPTSRCAPPCARRFRPARCGASSGGMSATERYREARDLLISLRGRHEEARRAFAWPDVGERFNWAVDWFDEIARGNDADRPSSSSPRTAQRGDQLRRDGRPLRPGRPLAGRARGRPRVTRCCSCSATRSSCGTACSRVMKLGAVIVPTTTAAGAGRPRRPGRARSGARAVVTNPDQTAKFDGLGGRPRAGQRRCRPTGWADLHEAYAVDVEPLPHPGTAPDDPLLLYFTSGHDVAAQARRAHPGVLPGRAPVDGLLAGPAARRRAPQPLEPRVGEARVVVLLRAVDRRGDDRRRVLRAVRRRPTSSTCCASTR